MSPLETASLTDFEGIKKNSRSSDSKITVLVMVTHDCQKPLDKNERSQFGERKNNNYILASIYFFHKISYSVLGLERHSMILVINNTTSPSSISVYLFFILFCG
jgi:hypothetical protein